MLTISKIPVIMKSFVASANITVKITLPMIRIAFNKVRKSFFFSSPLPDTNQAKSSCGDVSIKLRADNRLSIGK